MKKKILVFVSAIFVVVIIILGLAYLNLNNLIETIRPQLISIASEKLNAPVSISKIDVQLYPEIGLIISDFGVASDGARPLSVKSLVLKCNLRALLNKQIHVSKLSVENAVVRINKLPSGKITLDGLKTNSRTDSNGSSAATKEPSKDETKPETQSPAQFQLENIENFEILNSQIQFTDRSTQTPSTVSLSNLQVNIKDLSPTTPGSIKLDAMLFSNIPAHVSVAGNIRLNKTETIFPTFNLDVSIKPISISELASLASSYGSTLDGIKPEESFAVELSVASKDGIISIQPKLTSQSLSFKTININNLDAQALVSTSSPQQTIKITAKQLLANNIPLTNINISANAYLNSVFTLVNTELTPSSADLFDGQLKFFGKLSETKTAAFVTEARAVNLSKASDALALGNSGVDGILELLSIKATTNIENPVPALKATFHGEAKNGAIRGANILGATIGKITEIPGLGVLAYGLIPEKYQPLLKATSTEFDTLSIDGTFADQKITLKQFSLNHPLYTITGNGQIETNGKLSIETQLKLASSIAASMSEKNKNLKYLLDERGQLVIPVTITKSTGPMLVLPDTSKIAKLAAGNAVKDSAAKAIDKVAPGVGSILKSLF